MTDLTEPPNLSPSNRDGPDSDSPNVTNGPHNLDITEVEHASKMLRRMSSGGPSTVRLRLLILVAEKPRMRKELASLLGVTQATLAGHLDKVLNVNLVKETRERTIILDHSTIEDVIEFLTENLLHSNTHSMTKETVTNV